LGLVSWTLIEYTLHRFVIHEVQPHFVVGMKRITTGQGHSFACRRSSAR
jgi:hypothetical protein